MLSLDAAVKSPYLGTTWTKCDNCSLDWYLAFPSSNISQKISAHKRTDIYLCTYRGLTEAIADYLFFNRWNFPRFRAHQIGWHLYCLDTWSSRPDRCTYKTRKECILSTTYRPFHVLIYQEFFVVERTDSNF